MICKAKFIFHVFVGCFRHALFWESHSVYRFQRLGGSRPRPLENLQTILTHTTFHQYTLPFNLMGGFTRLSRLALISCTLTEFLPRTGLYRIERGHASLCLILKPGKISPLQRLKDASVRGIWRVLFGILLLIYLVTCFAIKAV
jgi:hypothetical protein